MLSSKIRTFQLRCTLLLSVPALLGNGTLTARRLCWNRRLLCWNRRLQYRAGVHSLLSCYSTF